MPQHGPTGFPQPILSPNALAQALGFVAWTIDPIFPTFSGTQANVHLGGVYFSAGDIVSGILVPVTSAASGITGSYVGIYDSGLGLEVSSPNIAATIGTLTNQWVPCAFSTPWTAPYSGLHYLGSSFTAGTTLPGVLNYQWNSALITSFPQGFPRGVHAQTAASGGMPNPAVSSGTFTNFPLLIAY